MTSIANLRTQLSEEYTRDPNFRVYPQGTIDRMLNKAYRRVQKDMWRSSRQFEQDYTRTTTAWTAEEALPADFVSVVRVIYDNKELRRTTKKEVELYDSDNSNPNYYYIYQNNIVVYPTPDAWYSIQLIYNASLSTITTDQASTLDDDFDDAILLYAAYKFYLGMKDPNAQTFLGDYQDQLNTLRAKYHFQDENVGFTYDRRWTRPVLSAKQMWYGYNH